MRPEIQSTGNGREMARCGACLRGRPRTTEPSRCPSAPVSGSPQARRRILSRLSRNSTTTSRNSSGCGVAGSWTPARAGIRWRDHEGPASQRPWRRPGAVSWLDYVRLAVLDLDRHDQVGIREEQEVALGLSPFERGPGLVEIDDDTLMGGVRQRGTATAPVDALDAVDEAGRREPGTNGVSEAAHSSFPRGTGSLAQSLCSSLATTSNPDG